jgi:hypothetical protein
MIEKSQIKKMIKFISRNLIKKVHQCLSGTWAEWQAQSSVVVQFNTSADACRGLTMGSGSWSRGGRGERCELVTTRTPH